MDYIFYKLFIIYSYVHIILTIPLINERTHKSYNGTQESNKTIEQLVKQQTDVIKKLVNSQQSQVNYPSVSKFGINESNYKNIHESNSKEQKEELAVSLNDLKIKCQYLAQYEKSTSNDNENENKRNSSENNEKIFISSHSNGFNKPLNKIKVIAGRPLTGFYITTEPTTPSTTTTEKTTTTTSPPASNIKFIKLEPVILQKTILNDGRTIYYWHKNLPTAMTMTVPSLSDTNFYYSSTPPTTTTTTQSSGYDFRNFFPSFYSFGGSEESGQSATEKTSTAATTQPTPVPAPPTEEDLLYTQQLKFVVPVPILDSESSEVQHSWNMDPYAYYPKQLQPKTVNVEMPYVPTFHIIKAITVPNNQEDNAETSINKNYGPIY